MEVTFACQIVPGGRDHKSWLSPLKKVSSTAQKRRVTKKRKTTELRGQKWVCLARCSPMAAGMSSKAIKQIFKIATGSCFPLVRSLIVTGSQLHRIVFSSFAARQTGCDIRWTQTDL